MPRFLSPYNEAKAQGELWTPEVMRGRGLVGWYEYTRPETVTIVSGGVDTLADMSGRGNDLTFNTARPAVTNFGPTLAQSGDAAGYLDSVGLGNDVQGSDQLIVVCAVQGPQASDYGVWGHVATTDTSGARYDTAAFGSPEVRLIRVSWRDDNAGTNTFVYGQTDSWPDQVPFMHTYYGGVPSGTLDVNRDGASVLSTINNVPITDGISLGGTPFAYGAGPRTQLDPAGRLGDLIVVNKHEVEGVHAVLEGYMAWNYASKGFSYILDALSPVHPYKNRPPLKGD